MLKIYKCSLCKYISDRKANLDRHILNKHTNKKEEEVIQDNNLFICDKCRKEYKTERSYIDHYNKCNGVNTLTCPICIIQFSSTSNKSRHIKQNNCKPRSIIYATNNIINNNTTNNINIYINDYKNERTDYITIEDILRILKENSAAISSYIELKYFNNDFPENCNIKFLKYSNCIVKSNNEWTLQQIDDLTNKLYNLNYREVCEKIKSHKSYFNDNEYDELLKKLAYLNIELRIHNLEFIKKKIKQHKNNDEDINKYAKRSI
jgi:uncharacterized C2H2 Zn-finger protein